MKVTHYLEIHNSENGNEDIECLTDKLSAIHIIFSALHYRASERYFVTLRDLRTGEDVQIKGLYTHKNMYSASPFKETEHVRDTAVLV